MRAINKYGLVYESIDYSYSLSHHGIVGQRWGRRMGPPYPLDASKHSKAEKKAGWTKSLSNVAKATGSGVAKMAKTAGRGMKAAGRGIKSTAIRFNLVPNKFLSDATIQKRIDRLKKEDELTHLLGKKTKNDRFTEQKEHESARREIAKDFIKQTLPYAFKSLVIDTASGKIKANIEVAKRRELDNVELEKKAKSKVFEEAAKDNLNISEAFNLAKDLIPYNAKKSYDEYFDKDNKNNKNNKSNKDNDSESDNKEQEKQKSKKDKKDTSTDNSQSEPQPGNPPKQQQQQPQPQPQPKDAYDSTDKEIVKLAKDKLYNDALLAGHTPAEALRLAKDLNDDFGPYKAERERKAAEAEKKRKLAEAAEKRKATLAINKKKKEFADRAEKNEVERLKRMGYKIVSSSNGKVSYIGADGQTYTIDTQNIADYNYMLWKLAH